MNIDALKPRIWSDAERAEWLADKICVGDYGSEAAELLRKFAAKDATHAIELRAYEATVANLVEALRGVIRVADRATDEFDAAKAAILNATGEPA